MRLVIAHCSAVYSGRLSARLPPATRLIMVKADGSVLLHSEGGSYKPLNWMSPPVSLTVSNPEPDDVTDGDDLIVEQWRVFNVKSADTLTIKIYEILQDTTVDLGVDPGLIKDGVEADLQQLLAEQIELLGEGHKLIRREYMTPVGPVDILATAPDGTSVAIEIKRRGEIDGVEQLTRYLEFMNRDPLLAPVTGVFAAQEIKPQARTLAEDRGIRCLVLDYDSMKGIESGHPKLF